MKRKVTDYQLVTAQTADDLSEQVSEMLKCGWQPEGAALYTGAARSLRDTEHQFAQTMVQVSYLL